MNRNIKKAMKEKGSNRTRKLRDIRTKLLIRFFAFLTLTVVLFSVTLMLAGAVNAADEFDFGNELGGPDYLSEDNISNISETAVQQTNPDGTVVTDANSALYELIGVDASQGIEILLLITIISIAPSILLMMTSFTRIVIVMGFLRNAMATQQTPPNQVVVSLALFLTMFLMWPVFMQINEVAYRPYADGEITTMEAIQRAGDPMKEFMLKQTSQKTMSFFADLGKITIYTPDSVFTDNLEELDLANSNIDLNEIANQLGFEIVIPAFMVSELSRAFQMGFMLFIPFLIIDIVVASTLMSMGMMMLPPAMISMPFKLMIFVLVDGWQMLIGSILSSFY